MDLLVTLALVGVGIGAGTIFYHHYFNELKNQDSKDITAESPISISFTTADNPVFERITPSKVVEKKKSSGSPLRAECGVCKDATMLPFRCKFCSSLFCGDHRLPESHSCVEL